MYFIGRPTHVQVKKQVSRKTGQPYIGSILAAWELSGDKLGQMRENTQLRAEIMKRLGEWELNPDRKFSSLERFGNLRVELPRSQQT